MTPISSSSIAVGKNSLSTSAGFTLLEILLVLTIIGLASVLVVPNVGNLEARSFSTQLRQASTLLNYARRTAVVQGQPASIEFYAIPIEESEALASRTSVGSWESNGAQIVFIDSAERETEVEDKIEITFFPEGGSTGGTLILALNERQETIKIDPFTGRVSTPEEEDE
ncbi:MAG: GspH/FimT family pseudopilin [Gammaproteobacteria bacterium]|nr:GspH/FimT family pseudopilin [Gammaproteobacteria bacterium]